MKRRGSPRGVFSFELSRPEDQYREVSVNRNTATGFAERLADNITAALRVTKLSAKQPKLSHEIRRSLFAKLTRTSARQQTANKTETARTTRERGTSTAPP